MTKKIYNNRVGLIFIQMIIQPSSSPLKEKGNGISVIIRFKPTQTPTEHIIINDSKCKLKVLLIFKTYLN